MKIDKTIRRETIYIAGWVLVLSLLTQAVFLMIGHWDYTVLLGNLLSGGVSILNFLLMGLTVQSAVNKEEKDAAVFMRASQGLRSLMVFAIAAVGVLLRCFNVWTVLIPLFFPRIAVALRPLFDKKNTRE
jgi:hypothetical protein